MTRDSPPAAIPSAARRGVPAPLSPARPATPIIGDDDATPANDRRAYQIGGLIAGWLMLNAFMAITDPTWWLP